MIKLKGVVKNFGGVNLLKNLSFTVQKGERVSLLGTGGSGKSTIVKIILGLTQPDKGTVELFENDMINCSSYEREQTLKSVGVAFQQGGLFDFMTVRENLLFAMEHMTDKNKEEQEIAVKSLLAAVKLPNTADIFPHELSGGMKRRVGIARALCTQPTIAIFDEPTSGLDPVTSTVILNMILALSSASSGVSSLVVTSNVEVAIRFAERLLILKDGEIVADGSWKRLLLDGSDWVKHILQTRLIGLDISYAKELSLPESFIKEHWS